MEKVIAIIPARGGSRSIPKKNIKKIAGKPLIYWTVKAAVDCDIISEVYIATENEEIRKTINDFNFQNTYIVDRSPETTTDFASSESVLLEFAKKCDFDILVFIQATSPLLTSADLKNAFNKFKKEKYDSLLSVVKQKRFLWEETENGAVPTNYNYMERPRRQDFNGYLVENGAFYITYKVNLLKNRNRLSGTIGVYQMSEESYYELDEPVSWNIVENLLIEKSKNNPINNSLSNIKLFAMDIDGVLTDGGMYYSEAGDVLKKFNTRDGKGIELIRNHGIKTAFITSENTEIIKKRANKLKIDFLYQGYKDKVIAVNDIMKKTNYTLNEIVFIGDDVNDAELLKIVGFSACPSDASPIIKKLVHYVSDKKGGKGCVREICDIVLENKKNE